MNLTLFNVANCPEHGLHGLRKTCWECGAEAEQVSVVRLDALLSTEALREMAGYLSSVSLVDDTLVLGDYATAIQKAIAVTSTGKQEPS